MIGLFAGTLLAWKNQNESIWYSPSKKGYFVSKENVSDCTPIDTVANALNNATLLKLPNAQYEICYKKGIPALIILRLEKSAALYSAENIHGSIMFSMISNVKVSFGYFTKSSSSELQNKGVHFDKCLPTGKDRKKQLFVANTDTKTLDLIQAKQIMLSSNMYLCICSSSKLTYEILWNSVCLRGNNVFHFLELPSSWKDDTPMRLGLCKICQKIMIISRKTKRVCSDTCRQKINLIKKPKKELQERQCVVCHTWFKTFRDDRLTCGPKCRQKKKYPTIKAKKHEREK